MQLRSGKIIELRSGKLTPMEYKSINSVPLYNWFLSRISVHLKNICEYDDISKYDDLNYKHNTRRNTEITELCHLIKDYMKELLLTTDFRRDVLVTLFTLKRMMYDHIQKVFELDPHIEMRRMDYSLLDQFKTEVDKCYAHLCYLIDEYELRKF